MLIADTEPNGIEAGDQRLFFIDKESSQLVTYIREMRSLLLERGDDRTRRLCRQSREGIAVVPSATAKTP